MERKLRGLLLALGILIMGSVAFMPLSSYAYGNNVCSDPGPDNYCYIDYTNYTPNNFGNDYSSDPSKRAQDGGEQKVKVTITDFLTLDAASGGEVIQAFPNMLRKGALTATVWSAKPFTISLSANDPNLSNTEDDTRIIPARSVVEEGKSGWGIKKKTTAGDATDYTALSTSPTVYYEGPANDNVNANHSAVTYAFEIGVWVNDKVAQGVYTTTVDVIAATKD